MTSVKLIGAGGYGGLGLIELILRHPEFRLAGLVSRDGAGKPVSHLWPYLQGYCDLPILASDSPEAKAVEADVAVFATPDGVGQDGAPAELAAGARPRMQLIAKQPGFPTIRAAWISFRCSSVRP